MRFEKVFSNANFPPRGCVNPAYWLLFPNSDRKDYKLSQTCDGEAAECLSYLHAPLVRSRVDVAQRKADDAEGEEADPGEAEEGDPRPKEPPVDKEQGESQGVTYGAYRVTHLVAEQYKLLILKRNSQFEVNKRLSSIRWATLYKYFNVAR